MSIWRLIFLDSRRSLTVAAQTVQAVGYRSSAGGFRTYIGESAASMHADDVVIGARGRTMAPRQRTVHARKTFKLSVAIFATIAIHTRMLYSMHV